MRTIYPNALQETPEEGRRAHQLKRCLCVYNNKDEDKFEKSK